MSYWIVLLVSLLASSVGFHMYIWFFSVGYGLSIAAIGAALAVGFHARLALPEWIGCALLVAYGLRLVPEKWLGLYMLNPVTPIITTFRCGMFGFGYFNLTYYLIGWGVSLLIFFIGLIQFSRIERTFMDTI